MVKWRKHKTEHSEVYWLVTHPRLCIARILFRACLFLIPNVTSEVTQTKDNYEGEEPEILQERLKVDLINIGRTIGL